MTDSNVVPIDRKKRPGRSEIQKRRKLAHEGVPFRCDHDDFVATVKVLNLLQRSSIEGLPQTLQDLVLRQFNNESMIPEAGKRTIEHMLMVAEAEEDTANQACILGFVWPRLHATQEAADAMGSEDDWFVEELDLRDRKKYLRFVMGQEAAEEAEVRKFLLGRTLAGVENPGAGRDSRAGESTLRSVADERSRVLRDDPAQPRPGDDELRPTVSEDAGRNGAGPASEATEGRAAESPAAEILAGGVA